MQYRLSARHSEIALMFVAFLITGCTEHQSLTAPVGTESVDLVTVVTAVETNVPLRLRAAGKVVAYATVEVRSQADGLLQNVHFHQGDMLEPGELMFTIDPRPFKVSLQQAKSNFEKDFAEQKDAETEQKQNAELLRTKIISQEVYDQSVTVAESLKAAVAVDQAMVDASELSLSYCAIRAPIKGRAGLVQLSPGNVIKSQEMILATLNQTQPIYVDIAVPEQELPRLRSSMAVERLSVEACLPGQFQPAALGELTAIDNQVDTNTGTIQLRASFANQDETLWPGHVVDVVIRLGGVTNTVVVPVEAVQPEARGPVVYVVQPNLCVEFRAVEIEDRVGDRFVLLKGIRAGEQLVVQSPRTLSSGMRVQIRSELATSAALGRRR